MLKSPSLSIDTVDTYGTGKFTGSIDNNTTNTNGITANKLKVTPIVNTLDSAKTKPVLDTSNLQLNEVKTQPSKESMGIKLIENSSHIL